MWHPQVLLPHSDAMAGNKIVNDTGIATAAHLYNALQQNDYLGKKEPIVWKDMQYLLELHKAEDTFMGDRPRSIKDCTKRLALVQGVAPSTFARRRRGNNNRVLRSRAGSKFLSPSTPVVQILGQKYLTEAESDWHLDQLDIIVGRKFDKDLRKIKKCDEDMNAKVDAIDTATEQGKTEILELFAPKSEKVYEMLKETDLPITPFKGGFAQIGLDNHAGPFHARWSKVVKGVLDDIPEANVDGSPIKGKEKSPDADEDEEEEGSEIDLEAIRQARSQDLLDIMDRWKKHKTFPIEIFVDVIRDSLEIGYLDIQFDCFAFFPSAFSPMLELQREVSPLLRPRGLEHDECIHRVFNLNEGAVCVVPQLSLLAACDPLEAAKYHHTETMARG